jgi:hypothetical protein
MFKGIKLKVIIASILGCCMLLLYTTPSNACECINRSVSQRKNSSQTVFAGTAIERERQIDSKSNAMVWRVKLTVERYWKGNEVEEIVIYSGPDDCASWFELGKKYLVFAYYEKENARLETDACMGTGSIEMKEDDLKRLGKGRIVTKK